jgi:hypothetical protein
MEKATLGKKISRDIRNHGDFSRRNLKCAVIPELFMNYRPFADQN